MSEECLDDDMKKMDEIKLALGSILRDQGVKVLPPEAYEDWKELLTVVSQFAVGKSDKSTLKLAVNRFLNFVGVGNASDATTLFMAKVSEVMTKVVHLDMAKVIGCATDSDSWKDFQNCLTD